MRARSFSSLLAVLCACVVGLSTSMLKAQSVDAPDLIVTIAPAYVPLAAMEGQERFPQGAQLYRLHAGKATPLVTGFAASADAQVSFDGGSVLFAAKQAEGAPWQIWELTMATGALHQRVASSRDAIRPLYLPFGQFVFAQRTSTGFQLHVAESVAKQQASAQSSGASYAVHPISFLPGNAIPDDVLQDGRVLFESNYPLGEGKTPELYLVYSDGSGVESYRCDHGRPRWAGRQLESGDVVFTHGASLARFTSSTARELAMIAPHGEYGSAVVEAADGAWILSSRSTAASHYALRRWKPGALPTSAKLLFALQGQDVVQPVQVMHRERPNHHPTALHKWNYANQLALDVRVSRDGVLTDTPAGVRLEALDSQGKVVVMGVAPVESDGSFFVQTPSDRAIRFVLLNAKGAELRREKGWFWIRSGEQRICTGCHAGPERGAENRVPQILLKTTTAHNLTGVKAAAADAAAGSGGK